uniref:Uncharacterized protein n=1 Tax=Anguilla anguilla TaxID=7936 RepID=A0A0E9WMR0_ANGAN
MSRQTTNRQLQCKMWTKRRFIYSLKLSKSNKNKRLCLCNTQWASFTKLFLNYYMRIF